MGKTLYLTFESSLSDVCGVNSSFDKGILRICYPGKNRNETFIAREDLERCVKTLPYVPVVGNYIRSEEDFGGHDVEVITTLNGDLRMVNKTQPVGVVPGNANVYFDTITDSNGEEQEYLFTDVILWKRQEAYKKIKEDGVVSQSMEIQVKDGEMIDGVYHIYDFEFTALCLLGSSVEPCFEDSALEVFATSDFKAQFELMMNDFKESFNLATPSLEDNTYSQNDTKKKGGEEDLEQNKDNVFTEAEIAETEVVTDDAENLDDNALETPETDKPEVNPDEQESDENEDDPTEEAEASEDEPAEEADNADDDTADNPADDGSAQFALMEQIASALNEALWNRDRIQDGEFEFTRYFFIDFDPEIGEVYFEDFMEGFKLFGCSYAMDGDNVVVDFESKKRMKYTIVDFDEGSQADDSIHMFEAVRQSVAEKYQSQIADYETELKELREFKAGIDQAEELSKRASVIAEFSDLTGIEEFTAICDNMLDFEVDDMREKFYAIRGKNMTNSASATFSATSGIPKFPVESNGVKPDEYKDAPYGGIVERYREMALV